MVSQKLDGFMIILVKNLKNAVKKDKEIIIIIVVQAIININGMLLSNNNKYLPGYASDNGLQHATFELAKAACLEDPHAGGITKGSNGKYTVRAGTELRDSSSGEVSWLKSEM